MGTESEKYYKHVRFELINEIPLGKHRVLEVGYAEGATSAVLRNTGRAFEVVGIELDPKSAAVVEKELDYVICGDLEKLTLQEPIFSETLFDFLICEDILEHLKDPWTQLDRLLRILKTGGKLIISLPNIRYYEVTIPLIFRDDWRYKEAGILDLTHLRFFTRTSSI